MVNRVKQLKSPKVTAVRRLSGGSELLYHHTVSTKVNQFITPGYKK